MFVRSLAIVALFSLAASGSVGQAQLAEVSSFDDLNAELANLFSATAVPGEIQIATIPTSIEWNDTGGKHAFAELCDSLSAWSPEIKPTAVRLSDRYLQYLRDVKVPPADTMADAKQRQLMEKTANLERQQTQELRRLALEWNKLVESEKNLPSPQRTAYSTFRSRNVAKLTGLETSRQSAAAQWQQLYGPAVPSQIGDRLMVMVNGLHRETLTTYSGGTEPVAKCTPSIDLAAQLAAAKQQTALGTATPAFDRTFFKSSKTIKQASQKWKAGGGYGPFSVSAKGTRTSIKTDADVFSVRMTIGTLTRTTLNRPWLDLSIVSTYRDTDIRPGSETAKAKPLFGESGKFALVPLEYLLAFNAQVTITMSASDYRQVQESIKGGGSFSYGPFRVGAGGSSGSTVSSWNDTQNSVTLGTGPNSFVVLGVRNSVLP